MTTWLTTVKVFACLLAQCMASFFFRGKEEIIGREIREFMENNKALEKELIEETGVSQTEISKYLQESVHLKEDKRTKLFRWYLEKKLSRTESGTASFPWWKYQFSLPMQNIFLHTSCKNLVLNWDGKSLCEQTVWNPLNCSWLVISQVVWICIFTWSTLNEFLSESFSLNSAFSLLNFIWTKPWPNGVASRRKFKARV